MGEPYSTAVGDQPAVRLSRVEKTYRTGTVAVAALRGISLDIPRNRFTMIIGPSGSGKTTLLNLIGCIDAPTSGSVEVGGRAIGRVGDNALADFRARNIGFIFQGFNLIPVLSAYENVEYPLLLVGMKAAERRRRTQAMLIWMLGPLTHRQLGAFWPSLVMFCHVLMGLWLGAFYIVVGITATVLILAGYFWAGEWYPLWLAATVGGGLFASGLWLRRQG